MLYKTKPLEWKRSTKEIEDHDDIQDKYVAVNTFGIYTIELIGDKWCTHYCFKEYYDDGGLEEADSLTAAKEVASAHWIGRLKTTLIDAE